LNENLGETVNWSPKYKADSSACSDSKISGTTRDCEPSGVKDPDEVYNEQYSNQS
jgi:hypothetical protein